MNPAGVSEFIHSLDPAFVIVTSVMSLLALISLFAGIVLVMVGRERRRLRRWYDADFGVALSYLRGGDTAQTTAKVLSLHPEDESHPKRGCRLQYEYREFGNRTYTGQMIFRKPVDRSLWSDIKIGDEILITYNRGFCNISLPTGLIMRQTRIERFSLFGVVMRVIGTISIIFGILETMCVVAFFSNRIILVVNAKPP